MENLVFSRTHLKLEALQITKGSVRAASQMQRVPPSITPIFCGEWYKVKQLVSHFRREYPNIHKTTGLLETSLIWEVLHFGIVYVLLAGIHMSSLVIYDCATQNMIHGLMAVPKQLVIGLQHINMEIARHV